MRLVSITVMNYRSITKAHRIPLSDLTTLVGPNNEGKSNILRALTSAMRILTRGSIRTGPVGSHLRTRRFPLLREYQWRRDYPLHLQEATPNGRSEITLEFEPSPAELQAFRRTIKSTLTGTLPLKLSLGDGPFAEMQVVKRGPGAKALTQKSDQIATFVASRLDFAYVPAIRTAKSAEDIVGELVARELQPLEDRQDYKDALKVIERLQEPVLASISAEIQKTLVQFLPRVRSVKVEVASEDRYRALRSACAIRVDDGTLTLLQHKGDGVQSLAALGIMRHASDNSARGRALFIAIEEPESHLHPSAIRELRQVLAELSARHQIILTTHNPLFVDRARIANNIVVRGMQARPAESIEQLREVLGIRAADNLQTAECVLVVEGDSDRTSLLSLMTAKSKLLRQSLAEGRLACETLAGGSNLSYKLDTLKSSLHKTHCFLDNDENSQQAFSKALALGLVGDAEVTWATCLDRKTSEFEDLLQPELYLQVLNNKFSITLNERGLSGKAKWSIRMAAGFRRQGKLWDDRIESEVKACVARLVANSPDTALVPARSGPVSSLIASLERLLE